MIFFLRSQYSEEPAVSNCFICYKQLSLTNQYLYYYKLLYKSVGGIQLVKWFKGASSPRNTMGIRMKSNAVARKGKSWMEKAEKVYNIYNEREQ